MACASVRRAPVKVETIGVAGARSLILRTSASKGATAGSIIAEWNACEVCSRRALRPSASSAARKASTASLGPATTQAEGPFSAASDSVAGSFARSASAARRTDSIEPAGSACISRPRRATRRTASASSITPASTAATNSPTLWPTSAAGRTPSAIQQRASAYSSAKVAGCVIEVALSAWASPSNMARRRSKSTPRSSAAVQASIASRNTGSVSYRPRPMPAY